MDNQTADNMCSVRVELEKLGRIADDGKVITINSEAGYSCHQFTANGQKCYCLSRPSINHLYALSISGLMDNGCIDALAKITGRSIEKESK